jgi:hypothetical protein
MTKLQTAIKAVNDRYKYLVAAFAVLCFLVFIGYAATGSTNKSTTTNIQTASVRNQADSLPLAQDPPTGESTPDSQTETPNVNSTSTYSPGQAFTSGQLDAITLGLTSLLTNTSVGGSVNGATAYYQNVDDGSFVARPVNRQKGALDMVLGLVDVMYHSPTASVEVWASDIREKFDSTALAAAESPTYNPGQGYNLLSPVRDLWRTSSNAVYIFYILIVIAIAFLIVFRSQLNGQNAVNLFNAIPSIIISLVMVYFSYPLSAVFIDIIPIGSSVAYGTLIGNVPADEGGSAPGAYLLDKNFNFYSVEYGVLPIPIQGRPINAETELQIDDRFLSLWEIFKIADVNISLTGVKTLIPDAVFLGDLAGVALGNFGDGLGSILSLVFVFAAFTAGLKLFFALLREYIILMIYPVLAPFFFLVAAIPGQTGTQILNYFKRLLAAALTFVAIYAVFLVVIIIARTPSSIGDVSFLPPMLGYNAGRSEIVGDGANLTSLVRPLIAYAIFISTPLIPDAIQGIFASAGGGANAAGDNIKKTTQEAGKFMVGLGSTLNNLVTGSLGIQPKQR